MKKSLKILLLTAMMLIVASSFAFAGRQNFTFHNNSSKIISSLYVSYAGEKEWGADTLVGDYIYPGEAQTVMFEGYEDRIWDIFVYFKDEGSASCYDFDLFMINNVYYDGTTFSYD